jgi:hypothetical protein
MREAQLLSQIRMEKTQKLTLSVVADDLTEQKVEALKKIITDHPGDVRLSILLQKPGRWRVEAQLPPDYKIVPSDELLTQLTTLCGESSLQLG